MGHEPQTEIEIFSHEDDVLPKHVSGTTKCVARLSLDLAKIPKSAKMAAGKTRMGWHRYYCLNGVIEAKYGSAMVTYTVKLGGRLSILLVVFPSRSASKDGFANITLKRNYP